MAMLADVFIREQHMKKTKSKDKVLISFALFFKFMLYFTCFNNYPYTII
jgi:hypothetical protein